MSKAITKKQGVIQKRNGERLVVKEETARRLQDVMEHSDQHMFVTLNELDTTINTADVTEVTYTAEGSKKDYLEQRAAAIKSCAECDHNGYVHNPKERTVKPCDCWSIILKPKENG